MKPIDLACCDHKAHSSHPKTCSKFPISPRTLHRMKGIGGSTQILGLRVKRPEFGSCLSHYLALRSPRISYRTTNVSVPFNILIIGFDLSWPSVSPSLKRKCLQ